MVASLPDFLASCTKRMWNSHLLLVFLLLFSNFCALPSAQTLDEEFSEELLLRPLPDRKVLAHFHFANLLPQLKSYGRHHRLFPKAIFQLVQKFHIQEMEISFTQGRWNYDRWGGFDPMTRSNAKPSGVELWAAFDVPDDQINATWRNLTHALAGLFCASVNFLESPTMFAAPVRTIRRDRKSMEWDSSAGEGVFGRLRYGALPREAVCTENLTPWLKLLPCRDKAGLTILLDRPTIYRGYYHSLRLHVRSGDFDPGVEGTILQQSLTLVMEPSEIGKTDESAGGGPTVRKMQPTWSLSSLFGRDLVGGCPIAKSSIVYLEFERSLVEKLLYRGDDGQRQEGNDMGRTSKDDDNRENRICRTLAGLEMSQKTYTSDRSSACDFDFLDNEVFTLRAAPQRILHEFKRPGISEECEGDSTLLEFLLNKNADVLPLNVGMSWNTPLLWTPLRGPFRVSRFLAGSGNARGTIALTFRANQEQMKLHPVDVPGSVIKAQMIHRSDLVNGIDVMIFQLVPWYVRLYFHTLQIIVDEQPRPLWEVVKWMQVFPSEDRRSPGVIEMELKLPSNSSMVVLTIDFDKGFLRIDEHPPDANRGFDLPAALLIFPSLQTGRQYISGSLVSFEASDTPLLRDFLEEKSVQLYTEVLLVPLATPDFSMPYNVITLTCTVLALYFGSLLNVLRRRVGEEERLARSADLSPVGKLKQFLHKFHNRLTGKKEDSPPSRSLKIIKILFIVVIAVVVKYYTD